MVAFASDRIHRPGLQYPQLGLERSPREHTGYMGNPRDIETMTFSAAECAKFLGISESGVRNRVRSGDLPAVWLGGRVLILKQQLLEQIARAVGRGSEFDEHDAELARYREVAEKEAREYQQFVLRADQPLPEGAEVIREYVVAELWNASDDGHRRLCRRPWSVVRKLNEEYQRVANESAQSATGDRFRSAPTREDIEYGQMVGSVA